MKKNTSTVAIVSARGGSKGIPKKNIKLLGSKPLIIYSLELLSNIKLINKIIVSTESNKIKNIVKKYFPSLEVMYRPKNLAQDKTPLTSVVKYVSEYLARRGEYYNFVLQVAPTCPFIKKKTVEEIINVLKSKKSDCAVTLKRIEHEHPYRAKILNKKSNIFKSFLNNINVESFISRQDLPELYCTSGAIYGRTYSLLKTFNGKDFCLGKKPYGIIVDDLEAVNIDRSIDFEFANYLVRNKKYKIL
jgi:CMP-N,N'-diacetyllegionaminic acid synthase